MPDKVKDKFKSQKAAIIVQQILMAHALDVLFSKLDDNKIKGIFLKGTILRNLYPNSFLRSMSDVDVYAEESDMDQVFSIMTTAGFVPGTIGVGNHYEYTLQNVVKVEYHPELVALDSKYGRDVFRKIHAGEKSIASYIDIWNQTTPIDNHSYALQLTPEYHYVYVIMHMLNHFLTAGTGIRSIMDIWVMNNRYALAWNRKVIDDVLKQLGLTDFEKYAVALADRWFVLPDTVTVSYDVDESTLDAFENYILDSGTYGTMGNNVAARMNHDTNTITKLGFLLKAFFQPYSTMKHYYPILDKAPVLLPAMWIYRVFDIFHKRGASAKYKLKAVMSTDEKRSKAQKEMLEKLIGVKS